jgi:protease IV
MWNFIKNVFTVVIGIFVFMVVSIVGLVVLIAMLSSGGEESVKSDSVLKLKLDKEIVERERSYFVGQKQ